MLVIHENKGLNDWVRSVAGRFAGIGYSALAIDLLSGQGGTAKFTDPAQATAALGKIPPDEFVANLKSGVGELQRRVPGQEDRRRRILHGRWADVATAGGGRAATGRRRSRSTGRHRTTPTSPARKTLQCLAFYGAQDQRVNATEPVAKAALEKAGLVHELVTEPDANHAFFNDTGDRYNATAADDAWRRVQDWLTKYVG